MITNGLRVNLTSVVSIIVSRVICGGLMRNADFRLQSLLLERVQRSERFEVALLLLLTGIDVFACVFFIR